MPLGLPIHQLGGQFHLGAIDVRTFRLVQVPEEHVVAVHAQRGGQVVDRRAGQRTDLRVIGSPPGPRATGIANDARRPPLNVGNAGEHVRHQTEVGRRALRPVGTPHVAAEGGDVAVAVGGDFHLGETGRSIAGDLQFRGPIKHQSDRPSGLLGQLGTNDAPLVGTKLRAEPTSHVIAGDGNLRGFQPQRLGEPAGRSRDVLRGEVDIQRILASPLAVGPVRFHAHVGDGVDPIVAFVADGGVLPGLFEVAGLLLAEELGAAGLLGAFQILLVDPVLQRFELHADGADGVVGDFGTNGSDGDDRFAVPPQLRTDVAHHLDGQHALDLASRRDIQMHQLGMTVRAGEQPGIGGQGRVDIGRVLRVAGGLFDTVDPGHLAAQDAILVAGFPGDFAFSHAYAPPFRAISRAHCVMPA